MNSPLRNGARAKAAEMQIISWFLEADWEIYEPVIDLWGVDCVVRPSHRLNLQRNLLSVQIKHRKDDEPQDDFGYINLTALRRPWPFDCVIILCSCHQKGLILPKSDKNGPPKGVPSNGQFLDPDSNGLARGDFLPWAIPYKFENGEFIQRFIKIMNVPI